LNEITVNLLLGSPAHFFLLLLRFFDTGFEWWEDLENTLRGKNTNKDIQFFDPLPNHVAAYNTPEHSRRNTGVWKNE